MAELMDDAEFWLPEKFIADDGRKNDTESLVSGHGFPTEFPYVFDSFDSFSVLSSPVESYVESTETERCDGDEFLAGLTRRLAYSTSQKLIVHAMHKNEKNGAFASSPRSTLSGLGCWSSSSNNSPNGSSQVSSPPTTPFRAQNDTWDLIYAAAGQVARLKMSNEVPKYANFNHAGDLSKPQTQTLTFNHAQTNQFNGRQVMASNWQAQVQHQQQQQIQNKIKSNVTAGRPLGLPQSSWPPHRVQSQQKQPRTHPVPA
ncbi:uncharacterized protein LOC120170113 [Hibiscus syriacus]|uniref:uncharacterized protein LOC120170113 n=1 Tax=Hibiscus syriacus TaxID=106335 RepID=UPI001922FA40|nr:uncharacterized protein LOC120170113 [Hibiscus syriacus]